MNRSDPGCIYSTTFNEIPDNKPLALADLDGTFTEPDGRLTVERFVSVVEFGVTKARRALLDCFRQWHEARKEGRPPDYEQYLIEVGILYARLCQGQSRGSVIEKTDQWYQANRETMLLAYAKDVFEDIRNHNIEPALVTGSPLEVAYPFVRDLGVKYFFSMKAETNDQGVFTGKMGRNTGLYSEKVHVREELSEKKHKIIFGIGDTPSDIPLIRGAIERQHAADVAGRGVLINPKEDVERGARLWYAEYINTGKLHIIRKNLPKDEVVRQIHKILDDATKQ